MPGFPEFLTHGLVVGTGITIFHVIELDMANATKHGYHKSPTYSSWQSMRTRCMNPKSAHFERYGARGITVCERWNDFRNFLEDMGERPPGTTIDRYPDKGGNYELGNCRWATMREQENNKRNNVVVEAEGRRQTVMEWSREKGIYYATLIKRLQAGWPVERALNPRLARSRTV